MNAVRIPPPIRPRGAFREVLRFEWRLALREPAGIAVGLGLPVFLLVVFGIVPVFRQTSIPGTSLSLFELYIPILFATSLLYATLFGLVPPLARDREIGWLRRLSTTPVSPAQLLAAQVAIYLIVVVIGLAVLIVGGSALTGFWSYSPVLFGGFLLASVLGIVEMFSLAVLIAALARDQKSAQGVAGGVLFPLLFFSGLYYPLQLLPSVFLTIGSYTPTGAAIKGMTDALEGSFPSPVALAVATAYAAVFGYLAIRLFRWE